RSATAIRKLPTIHSPPVTKRSLIRWNLCASEPTECAENLVHEIVDGEEARERDEEQQGREQGEEKVIRELSGPSGDVVGDDSLKCPPEYIFPTKRNAEFAQYAHGAPGARKIRSPAHVRRVHCYFVN